MLIPKAEEIYGDYIRECQENDYFPTITDYNSIVVGFQCEILVSVHDSDYQGDSRYLLRDGNKAGLLIFGWGSCSGCDMLQACNSIGEVDSVIQAIARQIHWEDSREDMFRYIMEKDWELEYCWHQDETRSFIAMSLAVLGGLNYGV